MDGTFHIGPKIAVGAFTTVSVGEYVWQKDYNSLTDAAVEAAELQIISDSMTQEIFLSREGHNGVPLRLKLEDLPKHGFRRIR